jgi:hypothetical protein
MFVIQNFPYGSGSVNCIQTLSDLCTVCEACVETGLGCTVMSHSTHG